MISHIIQFQDFFLNLSLKYKNNAMLVSNLFSFGNHFDNSAIIAQNICNPYGDFLKKLRTFIVYIFLQINLKSF